MTNNYVIFDDLDDDIDDYEEYFEPPDEFDCHLGSDGYCGSSGSEECEFECPYRHLRKG